MKSIGSATRPGAHIPRFSRDQRRSLVEDGYVILRNVVSGEYVDAAKGLINRHLGEGHTFGHAEFSAKRFTDHLQSRAEIPAVSNPFNHSDILPLAESLLGSVDLVRSENVQIALRFPQAVRRTNPIHIDGEYLPPKIRSFSMLVVVLLSDCFDSDMGNPILSPGSHHELGRFFREGGEELKEKMRLERPDNQLSSILSLEPDSHLTLQQTKQIRAAAGDAILLHGLLVHGTAPNVSPDIRYALVARFVPHGLDFDDFDANWNRLIDMWGEWSGLVDTLNITDSERDAGTKKPSGDEINVIHVISPHNGSDEVVRRTRLFYESVSRADKSHVEVLAASTDRTPVEGWRTVALERDARAIGDDSTKPFIKDLFDIALEQANPDDWLLLSNCDCPISPDVYQELRNTCGTVVEYMRRNVPRENSTTLEQLYASDFSVQENGVDGLALRAGYYRQIRDNLPNPLVGALHWDTLYSGILRRLLPVRVRTDKLFHPEHEPTWNTNTPACQYNSEIYEEALKYGDLARETITIEPEATDTAVVLVSFGDDPGRARAHVTALEQLLKQDLFCDFHVVELLMDDEETIYPSSLIEQVQHVVIRGTDVNSDLFQKEALMNIGWKHAVARRDYEYIIFVDADVYCKDHSWFRQIRDRLLEDPRRLVQGFQLVEDSEDPRFKYSALLAADILGFQTDLGKNPGLCWGVHRETLQLGDGLNPFYIDGSGDSGFVAEYIDQFGALSDYGSRHRWAWQIKRDVDVTVVPDCVPVDVIHVHHGSLTVRNYDNVHYAVGAFEKPLDQIIFLNDDGLLEWRDPDCHERKILRERDKMVTPDAVDKVFRKHNYGSGANRPVSLDRRRTAGSRSHGSGYQAIMQRWDVRRSGDGPAKRGLYVFNPTRIFRKHFPYSWCCHVRNSNIDNRIPMNGAVPPELVLDAVEDCEWFAAALPLAQSWAPVDVSQYRRLMVSIGVSRCDSPRLGLRLVSMAEDGTEQRSAEVFPEVLEPGIVRLFETEIAKFANDELDFRRVRIIEVLGHGNFCARLSRIVFE